MTKNKKPWIVFTKYSPYIVVDLEHFKNSKNEVLSVEPVMELCRCGESKNKPYCDGSHYQAEFVGEKSPDRVRDRPKEYTGSEITVVDNRGVCSHSRACIENLPSVFKKDGRPWIDPNGASVKEIVQTIEKCPSGALSYKIGSRRYQDLNRDPAVTVSKDGPLEVVGNIELKDEMDSTPESGEHYTLCRCGVSKNKPFCDGSHSDNNFEDEKN